MFLNLSWFCPWCLHTTHAARCGSAPCYFQWPVNVICIITPKGHCWLGMWSGCKNSAVLRNESGVWVWRRPVEVFVAAQVLQLHSLDLIVVQMKLMETLWEIWSADNIDVRLHFSETTDLCLAGHSFFVMLTICFLFKYLKGTDAEIWAFKCFWGLSQCATGHIKTLLYIFTKENTLL